MVSNRDVGPVPAGRSSSTQKNWRRERRSGNGRDHVRDRDRDRGRPSIPTSELVARLAVPKSKHKTILEWTENKDKKKKLEIEYTVNTQPPTNFSFVPLGNPELTTLCKELSREQGALMYIVSTANEKRLGLSDHTHRVGYHFRTHIVEQAASMVEGLTSLDFLFDDFHPRRSGGKKDPIPESQEEINKQADAAIRDLFPRIPNTDREMIIRHAFQKGAVFNGKTVVGLQEDLTLSRRVQLAVLAHIRHTHTRYDMLLRETSWESARRAVEPVCLDILVKWRGDEETGRDQLDEVLREIVVIDDSEDEEDSEDESQDETESEGADNPDAMTGVTVATSRELVAPADLPSPMQPILPTMAQEIENERPVNISGHLTGIASRTRSKTKKNQRKKAKNKASRNERRYRAWQEALRRRGAKTPGEQISRTDAPGMNESPRAVPGYNVLDQSTANISNDSPNYDYQAIYAIDDNRPTREPKTHLSLHYTARLPVLSYREKVLMNSRDQNMTGMEQGHAFNQRSTVDKGAQFQYPRQIQSLAKPRRDFALQDTVLPSVEEPIDLTSPVRSRSHIPVRQSQVMYQEVEDEHQFFPIRSNVTYVDRWEDGQPDRRRMVLANEFAKAPATLDAHNGYARLVSNSRVEQPSVMVPSLRHVTDVRVIEDRTSIRQEMDNRLGYSGHTERVAETRGHDSLAPNKNSREYTGNDQERRLIIDDDSPSIVRVLRRAPVNSQVYSRDQQFPESQIFKGHRSEDQYHHGKPRLGMSMYESINGEVMSVDSNQQSRSEFVTFARPSHHPRVAATSSTSLSNFSDHRHSHEINSGAVSYPSVSQFDYESRFSSTRNEPILVGAPSPHQHTQNRFTTDNFDRYTQEVRRELHRPPEYHEIIRVEPRYVSVESRDRVRQVEQHNVSTDLQGDIRRVSRPVPTSISDSSKPTYVRSLPRREDVIVLSP